MQEHMIMYNNLPLRPPRTVKCVQVHGAKSKICFKQDELIFPHLVFSWPMHTLCWMAKRTIIAKKKKKRVSVHFHYEKYTTDYINGLTDTHSMHRNIHPNGLKWSVILQT